MGEILLAFTIVTLTFIVYYMRREKSKIIDSSQIYKSDEIILESPINNRKCPKANMDQLNFFNGTNNLHNNQISDINSLFAASNPSYIKIKNINYNNINQVSPINNYSYMKNNNYLNSLDNTPIKENLKNPLSIYEESLYEDYQTIEKKIKKINFVEDVKILNENKTISSDIFKKDNQINYNDSVSNYDNTFGIDLSVNNKFNNTEKKIRINNVVFKEIDYNSYKKEYLNSEKKNLSINSLSKNINYYGVKNEFNNKQDLDDSFNLNDKTEIDSRNKNIKEESINMKYPLINKETSIDSQVRKKLVFNCVMNPNFDKYSHNALFALNCKKDHNMEEKKEESKILEKLVSKRNNCDNLNEELNKMDDFGFPSRMTTKPFLNHEVFTESQDNKPNEGIIKSKNYENRNSIKINNVTYNLNKNNYSGNENKKETSSHDKLKTINNINNFVSPFKQIKANKENICSQNKENYNYLSNLKKEDNFDNSKFLDLIPIKAINSNIKPTQEFKIDNKKTSNNLSSIREEERSKENYSSSSNLKYYEDSAKNISFASDNKYPAKRDNPITSTFILSSCLNEK